MTQLFSILPPAAPHHRYRVRALLAGLAAMASLAGCDIPTDLPVLETRWVVPAEDTRFGVSELLPGDVTLTPDGSAFVVNFAPANYSETLGTLCPPCSLVDGQTVPKPPFNGTIVSAIAFPPKVSSVTILDGQVVLALRNGLNFDPLRPAAGVTGSLTVTITDDADGDLLSTLVLDGSDTSFAPGTTLTRSLVLSPATIEGALTASAVVDSPLGDPVFVNVSHFISATATPTNIRVSSVTIDAAGESVTVDPVALDVEDVDAELADRVVAGGFVLDVMNPFGVGATFQVSVSGPTITTIQKSVVVGPGSTSTARIDLTGDELRSFLGQAGVVLSGTGVVDPGASTITVSPGQELFLAAMLDLTLRIGG